uniref:EGF-like domain-containing protein n=1 Tax=Romanomermis culicivorax TaxID=13658 RepID=A0A915I5P1_ROMCU
MPDNGPLRINLRTGRVTGFSEYIFFESIVQPNRYRNHSTIYAPPNGAKRPRQESLVRGCSMQTVLKIKMSNAAFSGLHFQMAYHRPKLWSLHLAPSPKSRGFGWASGSGLTLGTTVSELQIHNKQLRIYSGDTNAQSLSVIKIVDDIFPKKGRSKISMIVENHGLRWSMEENQGQKSNSQEMGGAKRKVPLHRPTATKNNKQSWAFQSDLIFDFPPYDSMINNASFLYVGLNRAVGTGAKYGSGLCAITVTLQKPREKRDECRAANHICDPNAYCKRNRNSARCVCRPGFQGNGIRCVGTSCFRLVRERHIPTLFFADENECARNNDIDECRNDKGNCLHKCVNSLGSYKCVCDQGYVLGADGFSCFQETFDVINFVIESRDALCQRLNCSHGCRTFSRNLAKCFCKLGFKLHPNGQDCVPTCLINNGGCQHRCINTVRGSVCSCRNGYILGKDKTACSATCSIENGGCERICQDTEFGARCSCPHGYRLHADNKTCLGKNMKILIITGSVFSNTYNMVIADVDECSTNNGNCHQLCINYPGTYECGCLSGYYLSSTSNFRHCLDVDECRMNHTCDHYCVNKPGTFECKCRPGFELHGSRYCGDINECSMNNGGCQFKCQNTIGNFVCKCPTDFLLHPNGKDCIKINIEASPQPQIALRKNNTMKCSNMQKCALSCKGVESASMKLNHGFSMECFTATYDQVCLTESTEDFDQQRKIKIQVSSLVDKCEYATVNVSSSRSDLSNRWSHIMDLCTFNVVCRKLNREDNYMLEINLVFKLASFSLINEQSTKFSINFVTHFVSQLIKHKLTSESLFLEFQSGTYKIRYNNAQSMRRFARKYEGWFLSFKGCSTNLYYDFNVNGCLQCPTGHYRIESEGFLSCTPCASNLWSLSDYYANVNPCTATCGKGSYSADGSHPCEFCPIGTYQSESGRISCQSCGSAVDTTVSGSQTFQDCIVKEYCRAGYYFDENLTKCTSCPKGHYQPEKGLNYCLECPANTTTDESASVSMDQCKNQYQSLIDDIVKDDRIYDLPNHESLLRNGHFLSALMDIMSEPSNYQKYMNVSTALFPRSFVEILWPKLHRFFDVADF